MNEDIKYQKFKKILKYAILFVLGCIMIYYSNILSVSASTISSNSIYACDANNNVVNSQYNYILDGDFKTGYLGTTYQGVMNAFSINFNASIQQGNTYTLELITNTGDWRNIGESTIQLFGSLGSKVCSENVNAYTITSVSATYYKIIITFVANSTASYSKLSLSNLSGLPLTGITNWKIDSLSLTDHGNQSTNDIIINQNQQTQTIIDSNTQNKNEIIDNQNQNNEELKDTITDIFTEDCHPSNNLLPYSNGTWTTRGITITAKNGVYDMFGTFTGSSGGVTIDIPDFTLQPGTYTLNLNRKGTSIYPYFTLQGNQNIGVGDGKSTTFTLDTATTFTSIYLYFGTSSYNSQYSAMLSIGSTSQSFQEYGKEICNNKLDDLNENQQATNDKLDDLNDNITNSDTSGADEEANNFFNDFESNDFGLSNIITLPLTTIQSITSKSCTPLSLTLPFVNKTFQLPCMTTIYSKFEPFYSIYQTITFGVISYWVCVQIYAMVKGFKDPTKDEIEVMDL